ncbi:adenine-specific methyltransferase EcoRI family protein [Mycoplasmopsis agassizii]|uniref:adenine-specific methyltransferase EcoRI family protein n=1 Tax=Mycoplasmopsis agassizii TaxID=33922 RepID=UPI0035271B65
MDVPTVSGIPSDYDGVMGVPITFLDKYNPDQFEIIGLTGSGEKNPGYRKPESKHGRAVIDGVEQYRRILIRKKPEN